MGDLPRRGEADAAPADSNAGGVFPGLDRALPAFAALVDQRLAEMESADDGGATAANFGSDPPGAVEQSQTALLAPAENGCGAEGPGAARDSADAPTVGRRSEGVQVEVTPPAAAGENGDERPAALGGSDGQRSNPADSGGAAVRPVEGEPAEDPDGEGVEENGESSGGTSEWEDVIDDSDEEYVETLDELDRQWDRSDEQRNEPPAEVEDDGVSGCAHYRRRCKVVAPCCGGTYWCRHCHNAEQNEAPVPLEKLHQLDRFSVKEIVCGLCGKLQEVSNKCCNEECGITFGEYFCEVCKFWDNEATKKGAFHCDDCGICRVGGRDKFFHCSVCDACYATELKDSHKCIKSAMKNACPICLEDMFGSIRPSQVLRCGHTVHMDCMEMMRRRRSFFFLRCPTCSKSVGNSDGLVAHIDGLISEQPLPVDMRRTVNVFCNDCEKRGTSQFHFIGIKCEHCGNYNTVEVDSCVT